MVPREPGEATEGTSYLSKGQKARKRRRKTASPAGMLFYAVQHAQKHLAVRESIP